MPVAAVANANADEEVRSFMDKYEKCPSHGDASIHSRKCARRFTVSRLRAVAATLSLALSLASSPAALAKTWAHAYATGILNEGSFALFRAASDGGYFVMLTTHPDPPGSSAVASQGRKARANSLFNGIDCGVSSFPNTILLLKAGSDGTLQWANRYQIGRGCTIGRDLAATSDGGAAIVAGVLPDFDSNGQEESAVLRIDANGGIVWQTGFQPVMYLNSIAARADGSIVVGGNFVIFLTPGGSLASFDSFPIFGGGPTAIALFPDGYAFAASDCILNSDGGCGATTPVIVRVGANPWTVHLPVIPDVDQFEAPYALVAAPGGSMIVQSDIGRDARIDPGGAIVWDQLAHPDFFIRGPYYPGAVDAGGVFWRPGSIGGGGLPGSTYLRRIAPDGSSSDLLVGSADWGAFGVVLAASGQMAFLGEDTVSTGTLRQVIVALDPTDQGCLTQQPPSVPSQPASFSTSGIPATYYVPGDAVSPMTIPITAVRNCVAVASADLCALPASQGRWTPAAEQAPGGGCPSTLAFSFDLDPATVIASPNPWNTPAIARVLTHKYGANDTYPSTYQIDRQDVTLHPRFKFPGLARNGNGQAVNIWFRVIDPPDTAPYVVNGQDAHGNDNKDTSFSGGKGILMTSTCSDVSATSTCAAMNGNVLATTTASDGTVHVVLETTDRFAGDNYQILASFSAPGADGKFPCEAQNTCAKSAPITAWKRIYEEQHSMFRRGSFLAEDAQTGDTDIFVTDLTMFRSGDHVVFLHSDGGGTRPVSESHFVTVVPGDLQANVPAHLHLDSGLASAFRKSPDRRSVFLGDAVGVSNGGGSLNDVYGAYLGPTVANGTTPVEELFATMFVDEQFEPADLPFVPLFDGVKESPTRDAPATPSEASRFAEHWFQNLPRAGENHRMLIGAAKSDNSVGLGVTADVSDLHVSYSFRGRIEELVQQELGDLLNLDPDVVSFENVAHELIHQWRVNLSPVPPGGDGAGHCAENAFDNPRMLCRMHKGGFDSVHNKERGDGIITLHYVKRTTVVDSEYATIRQATEPMP